MNDKTRHGWIVLRQTGIAANYEYEVIGCEGSDMNDKTRRAKFNAISDLISEATRPEDMSQEEAKDFLEEIIEELQIRVDALRVDQREGRGR